MARKKRKRKPQRQVARRPRVSGRVPPDEASLFAAGSKAVLDRIAPGQRLTDVQIGADLSGVSMSDVMIEFLRPVCHDDTSFEDMQRLVPLGILTWNIGLMGWWSQGRAIRKFCGLVPREGRREVRQVVRYLVSRKRREFGQHNRPIVDYELTPYSGGCHITILSVLLPGEGPE